MTALFHLLDRMFPGDKDTGLPRFSRLSVELEAHFPEGLSAVLAENATDSDADEDVNQTIKRLRATNANLAQALTETAVDLYFTHPLVTSVLQQGRTTLFPHERTLGSNDYDLLEPVFEHQRGRLS
jgi:hypothetical protein